MRYILGYALGDKHDAQQARQDYAAMMAEAAGRADFGAGELWSPEAGQGRRPSSIYAHNVTSLGTADIEMQTTAEANPRVHEPTMHLVFSLQAGVKRDDPEFIAGVRETLDRMGLGHHSYVVAVHRDTDATHAHVALGTVDPTTHRAMDRTWLWDRIDLAMRQMEQSRGWEHDRGLRYVRDGEIVVSTYEERKLWAQERDAEGNPKEAGRQRADALERRRFQTYENLEGSFSRYAAATIAPRLREIGERSREVGEEPTWTELHKRVAEYGAELRIRDDACLTSPPSLDDIELVEIRRDADGQRVDGGERLRLMDVVRESDLSDVGTYVSLEGAESQFASALEADPGLVSRRIAREQSTFTRDDVVRYVGDRVTDVGEVERLVEHAIRNDTTLKIVSVDGPQHIYSTAEIVETEARLADHARSLAGRRVTLDRAALDAAIASVERDLSTHEKPARLSDEQITMVSHFDRGLTVAEGDPGTGKTVGMRVAQRYAQATGKEIVGLTTSQAAAMRLQSETQIATYNTARGERLEQLGEQVIPRDGILVLDEAAMVDSRTTERLLGIARERNTQVIAIGDTKQLQPILAGQALRIARESAREAGTYERLVGIQRQRNDWHRQSVADLADALRDVERTGRVDAQKVGTAVERLDKHDVFEQHDDLQSMLKAAARDYCADRAARVEAVYLAASNETRRYANEAIRERLGLAGVGVHVDTRFGPREITVGDMLVLRENNTKLGVVNGDRATVTGIDARGRFDARSADGRNIKIDPKRYDALDHGYVISYHASQGSSVERSVLLLDKAASAELFFVGVSRSKGSMRALYSKGSFADVDEIAEHVASRSTLKTTSQTFAEVDERCRKTRVIPDQENHPLRPVYEAAEREKRERRDAAMRVLHERYAQRRRDEVPTNASLEERLEAAKRLEKEQRSEAQRIVKTYAPMQFGRYVHERRAVERESENRQRDTPRHREQQRERGLRRVRSERATIRERDVESDHGYER